MYWEIANCNSQTLSKDSDSEVFKTWTKNPEQLRGRQKVKGTQMGSERQRLKINIYEIRDNDLNKLQRPTL